MQPTEDSLSQVFHALADPTRRALIEHLARGSSSVGDLAAPFPISRPAISQHLRVLESAGLVTRTRQAQWRLCTLRPEPLDEASAWVARHRRVWEDRFDRLDSLLSDLTDADHDNPSGGRP